MNTKFPYSTQLALLGSFIFLSIFTSCQKDSDLLLDTVLYEDEFAEIVLLERGGNGPDPLANKNADDDGDGVTNDLDDCPFTPAGAKVNAQGCAASQYDADDDGVVDSQDQCPDTPAGASVDGNGCSTSQKSPEPVPDDDQDGVSNDRDICPNTPAGTSVNNQGCSNAQWAAISDDDGDGVTNDRDDCPGTPSGEAANSQGCSDSQLNPASDDDNDGVPNEQDDCPFTPAGATVNNFGCAASQYDTDGDGINDSLDQCPGTPAGEAVDGNGCAINAGPPPPPVPDDLPGNPNEIVGEYTPNSAAEIADPARANFKAIISTSFNCDGCTFAPNQTIVPAGGVISGSNLRLNGAYIENNFEQAFAPSARFSTVYELSRLSPDVFGGFANDGSPDDIPLDALMSNSEFAITRANGLYIKNLRSVVTRNGSFDWNMNSAKVITTSASGMDNSNYNYYLFDLSNISIKIYNGEFDGNDTYGRLFWLKRQQSYYLADLYVHNYYSPNEVRAVAFRIDIYPQSAGFTRGDMYNCRIDQIEAEKDYNFNDLTGISKGVYINRYESGTANIYHEGNTITNIIGDDAECLAIAPAGGSYIHNVNYFFTNETYKYANRRQAKITDSNARFRNCYFESVSAPQNDGQATTLVTVFSTDFDNYTPNSNSEFVNCEFVVQPNLTATALSLTEVENATITGNSFTFAQYSNYAGINLGSSGGPYRGVVENVIVSNNSFKNCGFHIGNTWSQQSSAQLDENVFDYTIDGSQNPGLYTAALKFVGISGTHSNVSLTNSTITVNASGTNPYFTGILYSNGVNLSNIEVNNVDIFYSNQSVPNAFGLIGTPGSNPRPANFDSSNSIVNCNMAGASGTGSITVIGSNKSVVISNSTDNQGNAITVQ